MRRSLRKRKRSEDNNGDPAAVAPLVSESPVPTLPAPSESPQQLSPHPCCNLCKKSCPDLRSDPETADKIIDCLGLAISPEVDPTGQICSGCIERVDGQYAFRRRALHCNSYVENGLEEHEGESVCRFCLKASKQQQLIELFPGGSVADEVHTIRDCLVIELNSWDTVTKICKDCVDGVERLAAFRAEFSPTAVPVKLEDLVDSDSFSIGSENDGEEDEDVDSDSSLAADEERRQEESKSKEVTARSLPWIGTDHEDRNFDVLDETDEAVEVVFEEYPFDVQAILPDGSSVWHCVQSRLRDCRVKLKIDAKGIVATHEGTISKHTHLNELDKLMECPEGKGLVQFEGKEQPFWLLYGDRERSQYTRILIVAGQKYILRSVRFKGMVGVWKCNNMFRKCSAVLWIDPLFEQFELRGRHNHPALAQWEIDHALKLRGIRDGSLQAIRAYQRTTSRAAIERRAEQEGFRNCNANHSLKDKCISGAGDGPKLKAKGTSGDIYKILQQEEPARNFKVVKFEAGFKVVDENSYEYCFSAQLEDDSTLWKCATAQIRNCKALAQVSVDGKRMILIQRKHNHEIRPLELLNYALGKRIIGGESVWLLKWFSSNHESRQVLYGRFLYVLHEIGKHGIIRWKCVRKKSCSVVLLSEGDFRKMEVKGEHTHLELPQISINSLLKDVEPAGQKQVKSLGRPADDRPTSHTAVPVQILRIIGQPDSDKNYTVKQTKNNSLIVAFGGCDFRFIAKQNDDFSLWGCVWSEILLCPVKLHISPDGKVAALHETDHKHNHSDEEMAIFSMPNGKRLIFDEARNVELPCYLYTYQAEFFPSRGLIYQGRKYTLCRVFRRGNSSWKCPKICTGYITVTRNLRSIVCKNSHQHATLTAEEIKALTGSTQADADLFEGTTFPEAPSTSVVPFRKGPLLAADLFDLLSTSDPDRNFDVVIKNKNMKIVQNGFEYYYNLSTAKCSYWKCVFTTVRACRATITLDNACKVATLPEIPRHSHSTKPWSLTAFPTGKSTIIDAQTGEQKPFWFRAQPNFLRPIYSILYEGHRYRLVFLNESGSSSTWGCSSSRKCNVRVFIDGQFKRIRNGNSIHAEPAMCAKDQANWIEEIDAIGCAGGGEAAELD